MKRKPLKTLIALALGLFFWVNISLVKTAASSALALTSFQSPETVVFIDPAVKEYEKLAKSVAPKTRAFILDDHQDGVGQIATVLGEYKDLKSIQIVSHGAAGALKLGEVELTAENVGNYSEELDQLGEELTKGEDIDPQSYRECDVAATEVGEQFVRQVSELTGADVAASKDKTGNSNLGGDWSLEYQSGLVSSSLAFQEQAIKDYKGVLEIIKVTNSNDSGTGSLRDAITKALSSSEDTIIDLRGISGTITLSESLPTITKGGNLFIVGDGDETISGKSSYQILSVKNTDLLTFDTLTFSSGLAKGDDGNGGGGGGLGAGGALFIDQGKVVVQDVAFSGNKAQGGNATGNAGNGGGANNSGEPGGLGGKFNITNTTDFYKGTPGKGGQGGDICIEDSETNPCPAQDKQHGGQGLWGTGGGGAGGGGGDKNEFAWGAIGRDGGKGGAGGYGGGGGGGGGGGKDKGNHSGNGNKIHGCGGIGGAGGSGLGVNGAKGEGRGDYTEDRPGHGGQGGGGAGLGGAIFARSDTELRVINSNFSSNAVQGGTGANSGQAKGSAIFKENNGDGIADGNPVNFNSNDIPTLTIAVANPDGTVEEGENARFTITADNSNHPEITVYYYISDVNGAGINKDFTANEAGTITLQSGETEVTLEITTLIDKEKEVDESFTITLLPTNQYKRGTKTESSATISIKDINYTAEIDSSQSKLEITEASDPLESATKSNEIDVDKLKSLGYVTVKLDKAVNGNHFNNALAAGLPVRYKIEPKQGSGQDYLAPQYNYNDTVHSEQIVDAVVVPVDKDSAKLYFAALPDVVKEAPEQFTLTIETFTDSNINTALNNVLGSEYQFYEVDSTNSSAALTINDSDEFKAQLIVVDSINEEVVSDDNLLVPKDGKVSFKVKLGSQPTADVTVNGVTFNSTNWNQYQPLSVDATAGTTVSLNATSADSNYNNKSIDLPTAAQYNKLKIAEGDSPDVSQRELFINVTANFPTVKESGTSDESGFSINLSQPISRELTVNYTLGGTAQIKTDYDLLGQKTVGSLSIPKYTRSVDIPINAIDNFIVDRDRDITITLSESSEFTIDGNPATVTIEDNDKADIIISQHNPDRPSDQDIAYLIPKIQIVGEDGQGGLIVQENEPLVEKIIFTKVGEESRAISSGASGQGLTKEIWVDIGDITGNGVEDLEDLFLSPYFPEQPSEASLIPDFSVEQNTGAFGRLRGLLTAPEDGDYTFTVEGNNTAELWFNKYGSNYEGREKIASGATITLKAGQQYYIEALYKEQTGNGKLNVKWTTPSSQAAQQIITSEYLTPFQLNKGFIKEVWAGIPGSTVEDLTSKGNYPYNPDSLTWLSRLFDVAPHSGNDSGTRIRGNLVPPETGMYKFWIASNDNSVLKLNPEGTNPAQTQTIAKVEVEAVEPPPQDYGTAAISAPQIGSYQPGNIVQFDLRRNNNQREWLFELTTNVVPSIEQDCYLSLADDNGNTANYSLPYTVCQTNAEPIGDEHRYTWRITLKENAGTELENAISFKVKAQNPSISKTPTLKEPKIDGNPVNVNQQSQSDAREVTVLNDATSPTNYPGYQQWDWDDSQKSEEIFLEKGKQYYIEALHKESTGDDAHLSVAWQTPSSNVPAVISAEYLTPSNIIIPIRISATAVEGQSNSEIQLKIEDEEFEYNGERYKVSGLTLKSDGNLNFSSGFIGKIETDTAINNAATTTVPLTPVEISAENEREVTLTEGQVARLGYQLATEPGVDVTVNLRVDGEDKGADIELSKEQLTFTPATWNEPQFVEVTAVKAAENYADSQIQIVAESLQGESNYAEDKPFVNVLIVPKQLSDDYRITIQANQEVKALGFDDTTVDEGQNLSAIQVQYRAQSGADPETVTSWNWKIENGALIAQEGAEELLRLEWSDLTLPIPEGNNPNLNLNVKVTPYLLTSGWSKGEVTISGIKIYFESTDGVAKDPDAKVTVSLVNGQPTLEAHFQLVGQTGVTDVTSFSYTPQGANLPIVASVADRESIITEFGELKVDNSGNWEFEPNINFTDGKTIVFTVNPGAKNITINPPENYDNQAQIITSQLALPDKNATLVTISASSPSVQEGQTTQLKFTLVQPADVDTKIYYEVETPNVNAPGNIALNIDGKRYINLGENGIPLGTEFTVELWARPTALTGIQGLLAAGEQYLRLNNRQIEFNLASEVEPVNIPDTIRDDEWFHIAYTVDASGQSSIYINGQKQWSEKQSPLESAPKITSIGKTGDTDYFKGKIDEVRLWDVARTETQIQRSRSITVSKDDANLKGYWNFNQLTPLNLVGETSTSQLIAADGTEILDWNNPELKLWEVRQSATSGEDYNSISGFAETQTNLFNLDAGKLGGRTTFAVADFNKDGKTDAVVLDEYGNLYYYENIGQTASGNPQFNTTKLSIKLEGAKPLTAGDIDGDGDIDLLAGSEDGTIALIENKGNAIAPTFSSPIQERSDGSVLSFGQPVSPTLVDLDGDGILELFTITNSGEISSFSNSKTGFFRQQQSAVKSLSARSGEGYFLQFIDLDRDGDLDLLIDHPKNRAGELPGTLHYLENFGTSEKPYFVEATDSLIVKYIAPVLHHVTYGQQTLSHPYDQVEFYTFADWDGDGDLDLLVSDNEGVIHLQENLNLGEVTISNGQTEATIDVTTIDDHKVEPKEFIKVNISSGLVDSQKYYTDSLHNSAVIEIIDNDKAGIVVLNADGTPLSQPVTLEENNPVRTTYQVKLSSRPEQGVYLKIASNSLKDGLVAKTVQGELKGEITLYFLPDEWDTPKSFVIVGVDDLIDDEQAEFKYVIKASSADYIYNSVVNQIDAVSVNNDKAGVDISLDNLPNEAGTVSLAEGAINTVKVKLTSQPTVPVTVILDPIDKQLTLYPQRKIVEIKTADPVTRKYKKSRSAAFVGEYGTLTWEPDGQYSYTQTKPADKAGLTDNFSYAIDDGYGEISHDHLGIDLPFEEGVETPLITKTGNLFYNPNQLAGDPIRLTFDQRNWNLERTVAVAAVDDDIVEYNHGSQLNVKLADPETAIAGTYGSISWTNSGEFTYTPLSGLTIEGEQTLSERFYFTQSTDLKANHFLDFTIALGDPSEATEEETKLIVTAKIDGTDLEPPLALEDGKYTGTLPNPITGLGVERMDAVYNALTPDPIAVNIEDNDKPIVRAAVNLNAQENTYPGYFTVTVDSGPVEYPGGIGIKYTVFGTEDNNGATAERQRHEGDPGPDFQGYDTETLRTGTLYIPEGKQSASLPLFPIDDSTPEESLAERFEKIILKIEAPNEGDYYALDARNPDTQKAGVRIIDNEEVGLKFLLPDSGFAVDEGGETFFRVGFKSQPQQEVELKFYYKDIVYNNYPDATYLEISPVTFTRDNWNQWQLVTIGAFNNLVSNDDDLTPRYTDIYFTLGVGSTDPFYNSMKGAINQVLNEGEINTEYTIAQVKGQTISGEETNVAGEYGNLTVKSNGDYTYALTSNLLSALSEEKLQELQKTGKLLDIFDYTLKPNGGTTEDKQQLAVEIRALNLTTATPEQVGTDILGLHGKLILNADGSYTYTLNPSEVPVDPNWVISDRFVYYLQDQDEEKQTTETQYTLNLIITQTGEQRIAEANGEGIEIAGDVITGNAIVNSEALRTETAFTPTITKAGTTTIQTVVTNMYIRDEYGKDLRDKDDKRVLANPIFDTNPIGFADDSVKVTTSTSIPGRYGKLTLNSDGSYTYNFQIDEVKGVDENNEDWVVHDRFSYHLSDQTDAYLELVTFKENENPNPVVTANGVALQSDDGITFTGNLIDNTDVTVERVGNGRFSFLLQEQTLDRAKVSEGLVLAFESLQEAVYDTDVPLIGRLGGETATDGGNTANESRTPSFLDRFTGPLSSAILAQPHFTTKDLEKALQKAINSAFGTEVPIRVIKFDTEKLLFKFSLAHGYPFVNEEFATDLGLPKVMTLDGQFILSAKYNLDVVAGVKFRNGFDAFIVTDQETLNQLLGDPKSPPTNLFTVKTSSGAVLQTDVYFSGSGGLNPEKPQPITPPVGVEFDWEFGQLPPNLSIKVGPAIKKSGNAINHLGKIVGIAKEDGKEAKFIEISLEQPSAISANSEKEIQIQATVDPDNLLGSVTAELKGKRELLKEVLAHLTSQEIKFTGTEIKVADAYGEMSQGLKINFNVKVQKYTDPTVFSVSAQTYKASVTFDSGNSDKPEEKPVIVAGNTLTGNPFATANKAVKISDGDSTCNNVIADGKQKQCNTTSGVVNITGTRASSGYNWKWSFKANPANKLSGWNNQGTKLVEVKISEQGSTQPPKVDQTYTLLRESRPWFIKTPTAEDSTTFKPVTKVAAEIGATLDVSGAAELYLLSASVKQAPMQPANPAKGGSIPEVYKQLVGKKQEPLPVIGNEPTRIKGKFGTLIINADGTYSYELAPALYVEEECTEEGQENCTRLIVIADKTKDDLKLNGIPSLEALFDVPLPEGWSIPPELTNVTTLKNLYDNVKAGQTGIGVSVLKDEFFIATNQEKNFTKLELTLKPQKALEDSFNNQPLNSTLSFNQETHTWNGGVIFSEPGSPVVEQVSSEKIQPVGKARGFFEVAIKDPGTIKADGILGLKEIKGLKKAFQWSVGGDTSLFLDINAGLGKFGTGGVASPYEESLPLPNVKFKLGLDLGYKLVGDLGNVARTGKFTFGIYDLTLDLGSLVSKKLEPLIQNIDAVMEPIKPVATALTADVKVFNELGLQGLFDQNRNGYVTLIEVPQSLMLLYAGGQREEKQQQIRTINEFLDFIGGISTLINVVDNLSNQLEGASAFNLDIISSDGYLVKPIDVRIVPPTGAPPSPLTSTQFMPYADSFGNILIGSSYSYQYDKTMGGVVSNQTVRNNPAAACQNQSTPNTCQNQSGNQANHKSLTAVKGQLQKLQNLGWIDFPILSNPLDMLKLIFGEPATLIQVDVPDFELSFELSQAFPVFWPVSGIIDGDIHLGTNIDLALDTFGLQEWLKTGDIKKILNGMFVPDWTSKSYELGGDTAFYKRPYMGKEKTVGGKQVYDKNELYANSSISVGGGLNFVGFGGFMGGGIGADGGFELIDVGEISSENTRYDGKIRALEIFARLNDPISLFDLKLKLYAFVECLVKVFGATVWERDLARFQLAEFTLGGSSSEVGRALDSTIVGGTVFFDANLNGIFDAGEPLTFTDFQGHYAIDIPYLSFDKNDNGKIDPDEGRVVLVDGIDTSTNLPVYSPLSVVPGVEMITPLTTLMTGLVDSGMSLEESQSQIKTAFGIEQGIDLTTYDPLARLKQGDDRALKVYEAQILANNLMFHSARIYSEFTGVQTKNAYSAVIPAVAQGVADVANDAARFGDKVKLEQAAIKPLVNAIETKRGLSLSADELTKLEQVSNYLATAYDSLIKSVDAKENLVEPLTLLSGEQARLKLDVTAGLDEILNSD